MANEWITWVLKEAPLDDSTEVFLLLVLADSANTDGVCWPSKKTIAQYMRMTPRNVARLTAVLEDKSLIEKKSRVRDTDHGQTSNYYQLYRRTQEEVDKAYAIAKMLKEQARSLKEGMTHSSPPHDTLVTPPMTHSSPLGMTHSSPQEPSVESPLEPSENLKDIAAHAARAAKYQNPDGSPKWPDASDDVSILRLEGNNPQLSQSTGQKDKPQTATDAPPVAPAPPKRKQSALQIENAAHAEALGTAWGIPPAPTDYALYIKKAQLLVANGISSDRFQRYCDWVKADAGDFASKLIVAHITENGRISKFLQWEKDNAGKESPNEFMARMKRERPELFKEPDTSGPRASAEAIARIQAKRLELAKGFKS